MKILQICEYYCRLGGTEHYVLGVSDELERLGHRVAVVYGEDLARALSVAGRNVYRLPGIMGRGGLAPGALSQIRDICGSERPDVIYAHNVANPAVLAAFAGLAPLVRYVHDHRLFCPAGSKLLRAKNKGCGYPCGVNCLIQAYAGRCLPRNPFVTVRRIRAKLAEMEASRGIPLIVASGYVKECLVQNGFDPARITVLPYFCAPGTETAEGDFLLFAGRIIPHKGLSGLLKLMPRLPAGIRLKAAGEGPELEACRRLAEELGLSGRVDFLGLIEPEALGRLYSACLALAIPSIWDEPFGIVGIEAMAAGRPVAAFRSGGIPDWLEDGVNGFLVPAGDWDALGERLGRLAGDAALRWRLGAAGREIWAGRFTAERHMERLLGIFEAAGGKNAHNR